jgi:hypothetical protein
MAQFSTTDLYLAAYINTKYGVECNKVGEKVMFNFPTGHGDNEEIDTLQHEYLTNTLLQTFIGNLKELRGQVYRLMKN